MKCSRACTFFTETIMGGQSIKSALRRVSSQFSYIIGIPETCLVDQTFLAGGSGLRLVAIEFTLGARRTLQPLQEMGGKLWRPLLEIST